MADTSASPMATVFQSHTDCTLCPLHETATHPGLPTRLHSTTGKDRAILFIGESPGFHEDQEQSCWVGQSGKLLTGFINASRLSDHADIYLTNSCRCRPPQNSTPTSGQVSKCRLHLFTDISSLCTQYKQVILVLCGATAVRSILGHTTLSESFSRQGQVLPIDNLLRLSTPTSNTVPINIFSTYHPAILLPGRKPALIHAVSAHFQMLLDYLQTNALPFTLQVNPLLGKPVQDTPPINMPWGPEKIVTVDIETYGILSGQSQTTFHPAKSHLIDGIPKDDLIITVSFCISTGETYVYSWKRHRAQIRSWFCYLSARNCLVVGQNIKFDLLYLRYCDPILASLIQPGKLRIDDTILCSFLHYEQRPERGLKELALLFGISNYDALSVTGSSGTAKSDLDPELHRYNCLDTLVTLKLYLHLWELIKAKYGSSSPKLNCTDFRNQLLWDSIILEQNGFHMDRPTLQTYHNSLLDNLSALRLKAESVDLILSGEGSQKSTLSFLTEIRDELALQSDPRVSYTDKRHDLCVNTDNLNLFLTYSEPGSSIESSLKLLLDYHRDSKLVNTYTSVLLTEPRRGIVHSGMCYPTWYPVPRDESKGTSSTPGGTIQGRFSCKKPAAQTFPKEIDESLSSRFPGGKIVSYDMSQLELRIGGLLSRELVMIGEYKNGIDRHRETALLVFPNADPSDPDFHKTYRQVGKTLNFLILYKGGPQKFQDTVMKDIGIHIPLPECESAIHSFYTKYPRFQQWQQELIHTARTIGYLELPTGWSRSFSTGQSAVDSYINEICNFPIQTIAAQLVQSSQYAIQLDLQHYHMFTRVCLQRHDAVYFDVYPGEEPTLDSIVHPHLTRPPLLPLLESHYQCSIPFQYKKG